MDNWQDIVLPGDGPLGKLKLLSGNHKERTQGVCVMEAVAWLAGEPHSDCPECACPVIAAFARRLNDALDHKDRQQLREFIPALVKSRGSREVEIRRSFVAADHAVRVIAPLAMEAIKRPDLAKRLRDCSPIVDKATAIAARDVSRVVRGDAADAVVDDADAAVNDAAAVAYTAYAAVDADAAVNDAADAADAAYAAYAAYAAVDARAGVQKEKIKEACFQLLRALLETR